MPATPLIADYWDITLLTLLPLIIAFSLRCFEMPLPHFIDYHHHWLTGFHWHHFSLIFMWLLPPHVINTPLFSPLLPLSFRCHYAIIFFLRHFIYHFLFFRRRWHGAAAIAWLSLFSPCWLSFIFHFLLQCSIISCIIYWSSFTD